MLTLGGCNVVDFAVVFVAIPTRADGCSSRDGSR